MGRDEPDLLDRIVENFSLRGFLLHQATLFFVATGTLIVGAIVLWGNQKDKISELNEFKLTEDKIQLSEQPAWIQDDLRQKLLSEIGSDSSILDSTLVPATATAIKKIGFVEHIRQVRKSKNGLAIDVAYREPVARVELSAITIVEWPKSQRGESVLLPVDRNGVVMPENLNQFVGNKPLITILYPARFDQLQTWNSWPDQRVIDAAAIGSLLNDLPNSGIFRIVTQRKPDEANNETIPFEFWPEPNSGGARIVWGSAPGKEPAGEVPGHQKLEVLRQIILQHGPIDQLKQVVIDVRTGKMALRDEMKTAQGNLTVFK